MKSFKDLDKKYIMNTYNRYDVELVEGSGCIVKDIQGKSYIDLSSGIGVNSLGFCDKKWSKAVSKQAKKLNHVSNLYYSQPCVTLAKKLCKRTGYDSVFFANSGAEANEGAIKVARKYSFDKYKEGRSTIVTLVNSFHGRTITTLSATGQDVFHNYFYPFTEGFKYVEANNIQLLKEALTKDVCAVMFECIQGEGGVMELSKEYVQELVKICKNKDILVICDEVQTGVGRTGYFLASQYYDIKPDITTLAKGLGGGLPIGAFLVKKKLSATLGYSMHGTTFGGNPIVCAGANVVVDTINEDFLNEVKNKADYIRKALGEIDEIKSISGIGLMIGLELKTKKASDVVKEGIKNGLIMLTAKSKVRLLPPLVITYEEIDQAIDILKNILKK